MEDSADRIREHVPNTVVSETPGAVSIYAKLLQMEGILKDVYKELGGAEGAIREERDFPGIQFIATLDTHVL